MPIDTLPADTTWIALTGPDIAPVAPAKTDIISLPNLKPSWLFATTGSEDPKKEKYPGVLFSPGANGKSIPRPILENTGHVSLEMEVWFNANGLTDGNSLETDLLLVTSGLKFAMPLQRLNANGQLQCGGWSNVGVPLGSLAPAQLHRIRINYQFDEAKKTCSIDSYECGNDVVAIGATFPAIACNWEQGAYIQYQLGSLPAVKYWATIGAGFKLIWS